VILLAIVNYKVDSEGFNIISIIDSS